MILLRERNPSRVRTSNPLTVNKIVMKRRRIGFWMLLIAVNSIISLVSKKCMTLLVQNTVQGFAFTKSSRRWYSRRTLTIDEARVHENRKELSLVTVVRYLQANFDDNPIVDVMGDNILVNGNSYNGTTMETTYIEEQTQIARTNQDQSNPIDTQIVVLMNANARGVSSSSIQIAKDVFGDESVYVTKTIDELYLVLNGILCTEQQQQQTSVAINKDHLVIVSMGGDGTLSTTIQSMCQILHDRNQKVNHSTYNENATATASTVSSMMSQLPIIAYVPLGTGNAVGSVVGCTYVKPSRQVMEQQSLLVKPKLRTSLLQRIQTKMIHFRRHYESRSSRRLRSILMNIQDTIHRRAVSSTTTLPITNVPMIEITTTSANRNIGNSVQSKESDLCFFAGVGFDSLMLDDFKEIKQWSQRTGILTRVLSSVTGYCVTLIVKTLPKTILRASHMVNVQVTTKQLDNTFWIDHRRGDFVLPCKDSVLYQGATGIIAGSTVPYYGGKLRLFPFARISSDKLHLRIGRIHPLTGFFNIPKIFSGTYRDFSNDRFGVLDFIGNDFTVLVSSNSRQSKSDALTGSPTDGFPLQHSGESVGAVLSFRLRIVKDPVRFLNLFPER